MAVWGESMKKCINGQYIEMTEQEIAEFEAMQAEAAEIERNRPPSDEDRLAALEAAMLAMMGGNADV